jgi:hypothetical protein
MIVTLMLDRGSAIFVSNTLGESKIRQKVLETADKRIPSLAQTTIIKHMGGLLR